MLQKKPIRLLMPLMVLVLSALACQALSGNTPAEPTATIDTSSLPSEPTQAEIQPTPTTQETSAPAEPTQPEPVEFDSPFPLPDNVQNFSKLSDEAINYQTSYNMDEVIAFYRAEFSAQGISERGILTVIEENAFSMVFDGAPNGKAIVLQGFPLDENTTNVNVRYEDI